jgi:hypothetical protein
MFGAGKTYGERLAICLNAGVNYPRFTLRSEIGSIMEDSYRGMQPAASHNVLIRVLSYGRGFTLRVGTALLPKAGRSKPPALREEFAELTRDSYVVVKELEPYDFEFI